eukprot:gene1848-2081_t
MDQRGGPAFIITKDQLEFYLENGFGVRDVAKMLSVSKSTVKRRLHTFGLSVGMTYTKISDEALDDKIEALVSQFPNCGYRRMYGLLMSHCIKITEKRVQASLHRVDPEGVLLRTFQLTAIQRRTYKVPGILALWHVDERINDHLKMFVHGWDCHKLSSESSYSPNQLWILGMHELAGKENTALGEEFWKPKNQEEALEYGIDWNGPVRNPVDRDITSGVEISHIPCPL